MKPSKTINPLSEYRLQDLGWKAIFQVFLPLILLVLAPLSYGLWRTLYGYSSFGPAAALKWGRLWFLISGILVIFLLLYTLRRLIRSHTWIRIYPWGIEYHLPLRRKKKLMWEEISGISTYSINKSFTPLINRKKHYLVIYSGKSRPFVCHPELSKQPGLIKVIKEQVYKLLKPKLTQAFLAGKTIPFGGLSISKTKAILPSTEIPWEFLAGISIEKGNFLIKLTAGNTIQIPIRNLINLEILVQLIKTEI
jgi:hypothetical protein